MAKGDDLEEKVRELKRISDDIDKELQTQRKLSYHMT